MFFFCIFFLLSLLHNGENRDFLMKMGQKKKKKISKSAKKSFGWEVYKWIGRRTANTLFLWAAFAIVPYFCTLSIREHTCMEGFFIFWGTQHRFGGKKKIKTSAEPG